jgi:Flp pilus assembly protein TadD
MGRILEKRGDLEGALAQAKRAYEEVSPKDDFLLRYLVRLYAKLKRHSEAIELAKKALEGDPTNARLHFALGVAYDKAGDPWGAIREMEEVVRLEPDNADALNYLGYTLAVLGVRLEEAENFIRRALEIKPGDGYIIDSLGWVFFKQGRMDEALRELERAAQLVPTDPIILEHLGDVLSIKGDKKRARDLYEKALQLESEERTDAQKRELEEKYRKLVEELR